MTEKKTWGAKESSFGFGSHLVERTNKLEISGRAQYKQTMIQTENTSTYTPQETKKTKNNINQWGHSRSNNNTMLMHLFLHIGSSKIKQETLKKPLHETILKNNQTNQREPKWNLISKTNTSATTPPTQTSPIIGKPIKPNKIIGKPWKTLYIPIKLYTIFPLCQVTGRPFEGQAQGQTRPFSCRWKTGHGQG